jgi:hypothetical protein
MSGRRKTAVMPPPEFEMSCMGASDDSGSARTESSAVAVEHCRVWLNWAAVQVDACMTSDNLASDQLLASLSDLLGEARTRAAIAPTPAGAGINAKMSAVIVAVQSHDRVMQGFAHVAESLRALQELLGDSRRADSADAWRMLRAKQFLVFSMAEERALFARMVAREDESRREAALNPEETVELFTTDRGLYEP